MEQHPAPYPHQPAGGASQGATLPFGPASPWLAPLAGFSDLPFRLLCRELGAAVACTEMVSAKGLVLGQGKKTSATDQLLATWPMLPPVTGSRNVPLPFAEAPERFPELLDRPPPADLPLVVQLFGAERSYLEQAVAMLRERGYIWFDLNMGCSVPKVGKSGSGSAMLKDLQNALDVAGSMIAAAGPGRVGFKLRLGWQAGEEALPEIATELEKIGAGWITLHPRYARQGFSGNADWQAIATLRQHLAIPLLASGDLFCAEDGLACLEQTGANGVMYARGALHDPAIFRKHRDLWNQAARLAGASARSLCSQEEEQALLRETEDVIRRHAQFARAFMPPRLNRQGIEAGLLKMRTFVPRYVKRFSGARSLRQALTRCEQWADLEQLLAAFFKNAAVTAKASEELCFNPQSPHPPTDSAADG